jgi:phosphomevalonate kinase
LWAGWILYRVVSAPGKVLITGAYLVLERPNAGLVLSTSARFYAIVKPIHSDVAPDSWSWVRPPSFHDFICQWGGLISRERRVCRTIIM